MYLDDNLFTKEQSVHIYNRVILTVGIKKIRTGQIGSPSAQHTPINKFNNILIYLLFPLKVSERQSEIQMLHVNTAKNLSVLCEKSGMKTILYFNLITNCSDIRMTVTWEKCTDIRLRQPITLVSN